MSVRYCFFLRILCITILYTTAVVSCFNFNIVEGPIPNKNGQESPAFLLFITRVVFLRIIFASFHLITFFGRNGVTTKNTRNEMKTV